MCGFSPLAQTRPLCGRGHPHPRPPHAQNPCGGLRIRGGASATEGRTRPRRAPADETPTAKPQHMPAHFHPSKRHRGRRVITWFSGYGGFRESTIRCTPGWTVVGGTEDTRSDKGAKIAALWEDNNPHGKILGHHDEA